MRRPNILILYTDQQRWDALGAAGNPHIRTPNLDRLAGGGLRFDRFYVQNPVCMPSRYSFLTGQYCSTLRVLDNGVPVPEDAPTLPRLLRPYGYSCANIGKLHFLPHATRDHRSTHPDYGFDHLEISDEPGCYEDAYRAWIRARDPRELAFASLGLPPAAEGWDSVTRPGDKVPHPSERFPFCPLAYRGSSDFTHTAFVAEQTIEYLRGHSQQEKPFLCIAGFYSPHSPWVAPQEFLDLYDPAELPIVQFPETMSRERRGHVYTDEELRGAVHGYYAMCSEVDHHVGRILQTLDQCGLGEDTIVVFTADHGEFLGEYLNYGKGFPSPDCIARVPCIVRWPRGIAEPGRVCPHFVEAVDMLPTLLDCAGIPVPRNVQGKALPLAPNASATRESALTEMRGARSLHTRQHHYIVRQDGQETLYDLDLPHGQYLDKADDPAYRDQLAELRLAMLRRVLACESHAPRTAQY
jgi:arylsulfatase A-like enzyme